MLRERPLGRNDGGEVPTSIDVDERTTVYRDMHVVLARVAAASKRARSSFSPLGVSSSASGVDDTAEGQRLRLVEPRFSLG